MGPLCRRLGLPLLLALAASLLVVSASGSVLRMVPEKPTSGLSVAAVRSVYCNSWRLSVETNNAGNWAAVPSLCTSYVRKYMSGTQYSTDCAVATSESISYANTISISGDGKDAWVFDVDDTLLSNAKFFTNHLDGVNLIEFYKWINSGNATAIPPSLQLYRTLQSLGCRIFLLTGRTEEMREATERNLLKAGYRAWDRLILRSPSDSGKTQQAYKSEKRAELESEGYRIHGSSGDQWSDLLGSPLAGRSFKIPNPMYYAP